MSRIGKSPIPVPQGVTVTINGEEVKVKGPKGELKQTLRPEITVKQEDGKLIVARTSEDRFEIVSGITLSAATAQSCGGSRHSWGLHSGTGWPAGS